MLPEINGYPAEKLMACAKLWPATGIKKADLIILKMSTSFEQDMEHRPCHANTDKSQEGVRFTPQKQQRTNFHWIVQHCSIEDPHKLAGNFSVCSVLTQATKFSMACFVNCLFIFALILTNSANSAVHCSSGTWCMENIIDWVDAMFIRAFGVDELFLQSARTSSLKPNQRPLMKTSNVKKP